MALLIYANGIVTPASSIHGGQRTVEESQASTADRQGVLTRAPRHNTAEQQPLGRSRIYLDTERRSDSLQERRKLQALHIMSSPVICATPMTSTIEALARMEQADIDHLVILDADQQPVSLITRIELMQADLSEDLPLQTLLSEQLCAVTEDTLVRDIARYFMTQKVSAMPVISRTDQQLVGIICRTDLLHLLVSGPNVQHQV